MARLGRAPATDAATLWAQALWRAATPCVAIALLLSVWSFVGTQELTTSPGGTETGDLAAHFEQTMLAAVADEPAEESW